MTAAAQTCHRVALASRKRMEELRKCWKKKSVAHTMAKAVIEFWHSARLSVENLVCSQSEKCNIDNSSGADETGHTKGEAGNFDKVLVVNLLCGFNI